MQHFFLNTIINTLSVVNILANFDYLCYAQTVIDWPIYCNLQF